MVDRAIMDSRWKPEKVVVFQREQCLAELNNERDLHWQQAVAGAEPHECVPFWRQTRYIFCIPQARQVNLVLYVIIADMLLR